MKKLIIFDIDGTLTSCGNKIEPDVIYKINDLINKGYKVGLSTGRSLWETLPFIELVKPNFPTVCMDGRVVYDQTTKKIEVFGELNTIELDEIQERFGQVTTIIVENAEGFLVKDTLSEKLLKMAFNVPKEFIKVEPTSPHSALKFYLYNRHGISTDLVIKLDRLNKFSPGPKWIILSRKEITKYSALSILCMENNIKIDSVIAFGDGENDIELIRNVGIGVAMGNAVLALKKVAKYITDDVNKAGVLPVLNKLIK